MTMTIVFIFIILIFFAGIADAKMKMKKHQAYSKSRFERTFGSLKDLKIDSYYIPEELTPSLATRLNQNYAIGFDNAHKKLCFFDKSDKSYIFDYSQILQCEMDIDGETYSKTSTSSAVGRAVLGGILTGGLGAIIGGTTGKRTQKQTIRSMDLKIVVNDTTSPVFKINFFTGKAKKGTLVYKTKYAEIEKWDAIVSGLIRHGSDQTATRASSGSVADELKKLKELLDGGAISQGEYDIQKQKILA